MMIATWWRRWVRSKVQPCRYRREHRRRPHRRHSRPEVVCLEERCLPAVNLGTNFAGLDFPGSGQFVPPSTQIAAGPNHLVQVVNSQIAIYNKLGVLLFSQPLNAFFNSGSPNPIEPVVLYDDLANRFVVGALQRDLGTQLSFFYLAVSNASDPLAGFTERQRINVQQITASGQRAVADYLKIGWNADAYVCTFNMYAVSGGTVTYDHTQLLTVAKSSVLDANPGTLTGFQVDRANQFSLVGAATHSSVAGDPIWLVRSGGGGSGSVQVTQMTNVLSATPTFTDVLVAVPTYANPAAAPQRGTTDLLATGDTRILNVALRGNRLVASHNVGAGGVAHARWYEFNLSGVPSLTQLGEINPGAGVATYYPALEIAANGDLGLTYMESSSSEFMSMYITGRTATDPLGTMQTPVVVQSGQRAYSDFSGTSPYLAGDYSGISVDPSSGTTFWATNEFATNAASTNWGSAIATFNLTSVTGTIGGQVFNDLNGNGTKDTGEPGLPGFTLFLDSNNNDVLDAGEPTTLSDASGNYSFANLPLGIYRVREVSPTGWVRTTANPGDVLIFSGSSVPSVNFGNFQLMSISGQAFNDLNGNGTRDTGEPGLSGWTIFLDSNNNGTLDTGEPNTTTDSNGNYSFANLGPGTYRVREVTQGGFVRSNPNPPDILASSGSNITGVNFSNLVANTISGQVFHDLNGNASKDAGEPGLSGWTIFLDSTNNGTLDAGETSTLTDSTGNYSFANLPAGLYRVREVVQPGFVRTTSNSSDIVLFSGSSAAGINFGNFQLLSLSGQVFNDREGNGTKDPTDPGLQGFTIFLDSNNNGTLDTGEANTLSDANGNYSFPILGPGTYRVREVLPAGWVRTTANPSDVVVSSGTAVAGINLGNFQLISLSGQVFNDLDSNGSKDTGEPGLPGGTIFLDSNSNGTLDASEVNTITDANGNYSFANRGPGTYRVRQVVPTGGTQTTANPADIVASSGSPVTGVNFGNKIVAPGLPSFDFGTDTSPVASGFTQVTPATTYHPTRGYGWLSGTIDSQDYPTEPDPLKRDFNFTTQGIFAVDVASGTYDVTLTLGSAGFAHEQMGVFLEGSPVDSVTAAAGVFVTRTYRVSVRDGQLTLELRDLGGDDPFVVVNSLELAVASPPPPARRFDFGAPTSPVASGYTQVTPATVYSAALGYGWQSGSIDSRDYPTEPDPLKRDFNYTTQGIFAVDLANGTYTVTVTLGSPGFFKDQMGIFLEGAQVDAVSTAAGEVVLKAYAVTVTDGQLTLELRDLGGDDPFVVVNGLEIVPSGGTRGQAPTNGDDDPAALVPLMEPLPSLFRTSDQGSATRGEGSLALAPARSLTPLGAEPLGGLPPGVDLESRLVEVVFAHLLPASRAPDLLDGAWEGPLD